MQNLYGNGILGNVEVAYDVNNNRRDTRNYYFKDHLGSIKITFNEGGTITNAQDYYSYGEILRSYYTGGNLNDKYKFTEKERDTETNYDYFPPGRTYDSELARWLSVDPLADKYPGWSPYNYTLNNPLRYIDPDGMRIGDPINWGKFSLRASFGTLVNSAINTIKNATATVTGWIKSPFSAIEISLSKNSKGTEIISKYKVGNENLSIETNSNGEISNSLGVGGIEVTSDGNNVTVSGETPGPVGLKGSMSTNGEMSIGGKAEVKLTEDLKVGLQGEVKVNPGKEAAKETKKVEREILDYFKRD